MACNKCKKCKDCVSLDFQLGCVKECDKNKCDSIIDSRCIFINCGSDGIIVNVNGGPPRDGGSSPRDPVNPDPNSQEQSDENKIIIPSCISLYEYINYLTLIQSNPTCVVCGGNSYSVTDLYVESTSNNTIKITFSGIDSDCLSQGWSVIAYDIVIKDITTNTIYTLTVYPTPTNIYGQNVGAPIIVAGHTYTIKVITKTQNGTNNHSCESITIVIKM